MNDVITHERATEIVTIMAQAMLEVHAPYKVHQDRIGMAKALMAHLEQANSRIGELEGEAFSLREQLRLRDAQ